MLNLINTAISIANDRNGVAVKGLDLLGIKIQAGVVEPPSIAIGGVGSRAYNAQVAWWQTWTATTCSHWGHSEPAGRACTCRCMSMSPTEWER